MCRHLYRPLRVVKCNFDDDDDDDELCFKEDSSDNQHKFDADIVSTVNRDFYVDDLLKSVKNSEEPIRIYKQVSMLPSLGGFRLTKWISNSQAVINATPEAEWSKELKDAGIEDEDLPTERALGLQWNAETDKFTFMICQKEKPFTRRGSLSIISSVYDPIGFVSPFILMQRLSCKDFAMKRKDGMKR